MNSFVESWRGQVVRPSQAALPTGQLNSLVVKTRVVADQYPRLE